MQSDASQSHEAHDAEQDESSALSAAAHAVLVESRSPRHAARMLGVSRETFLALLAGAAVSRGTRALVRERLRALGRATPAMPAALSSAALGLRARHAR